MAEDPEAAADTDPTEDQTEALVEVGPDDDTDDTDEPEDAPTVAVTPVRDPEPAAAETDPGDPGDPDSHTDDGAEIDGEAPTIAVRPIGEHARDDDGPVTEILPLLPAVAGPTATAPAAAEDEDGTDDGEKDEAAEPPAPAGRSLFGRVREPGVSRAALLIGLLCGLLGFGIAVQVRSTTESNGLSGARQEDLVRILDDLSSRDERLRRQITSLEQARTRLTTTGDRTTAALGEAQTRSTNLGILAGTVAAQGPGIRIVIDDPKGGLTAEDMLDAVEELRAAGAEAIQVGPVRIGLDSAFVDTDGAISADQTKLTAPYEILAIGDPPTLATALDIPGGVTDTVRRAGGGARAEQRDRVVIRALRGLPKPQYAQPD